VNLYSPEYQFLWALGLAIALFFPVRQVIWVLYVRRARRFTDVDEAEQQRLKRRAGFTAALLCLLFAALFTNQFYLGRS
jgi:hypothetical protein